MLKLVIKCSLVLPFFLFLGIQTSSASEYEALKNSLREKIVKHTEKLFTGDWIDKGGLEVLTAGPSSSVGQSRFGHVALRFVNSGNEPLSDIVFEALAINDIKDSELQLIKKGVSGDYPVSLLPSLLSQVIVNYYAIESRGYSRTILPSTPILRRRLLEKIQQIALQSFGEDRYYFFTNNCADYLAQILQESGFSQVDTPQPFLPTMFSQHLRRSLLTPWPDLASLSREHITSLIKLGQKTKSFSNWKTIDLQQYVIFSDKKQMKLFNANVYSELNKRANFASTEAVYGFVESPMWMYQRSKNLTKEINMATFDSEILSFQILQLNAIENSTYTHTFCMKNFEQCNYFTDQKRYLQGQGL